MSDFLPWSADDAARHIAVPGPGDDKYTRGVLGIITGSEQYPGAAVLGVEAALRTGVGMVRYLGGERAGDLVLQRRPEAVLGDGRVQAWLIGSGTDAARPEPQSHGWVDAALAQGLPTVLDGGALERLHEATGPVVITPHFRELGRVLGADPAEIALDPASWARRASDTLGVTVLLKGSTTYVSGGGLSLSVTGAPTWTATAGAGDVLGGILGALVATHAGADAAQLARLAATAAHIHGAAAGRASAGGPFTILDLAAAIPATMAQLLR